MTIQPLITQLRELARRWQSAVAADADRYGPIGAELQSHRSACAAELLALLDSLPALPTAIAPEREAKIVDPLDKDDLTSALTDYVAAWVDRVAPRIRDEMALAKLEIVLTQPQSEEDGTLYLDFSIDETVTADRSGARVTGHRFDPEPR